MVAPPMLSGLLPTCFALCDCWPSNTISLEELGDLDTLLDRIRAEVAAANTVASLIAVVGAWSRKPINVPNPGNSQGSTMFA
jgi:hypothetical protein